MATRPRLNFPLLSREIQESSESPATLSGRRIQPQLQLHTTETREGYRLAVPGSRRHSRPSPVRTLSTPPGSPTRIWSSTMGSQYPKSMHDSGALTPPITPTGASHSKTNSASSDFLHTLSSLRRGDSTSPRTSQPWIDESAKPGSTELLTFPHQLTDYEFRTNSDGKKKTIGEGLWSDVYLAKSTLPKPSAPSFSPTPTRADMTPPITPVRSRNSSLGASQLPIIPPLYAIKVPASTSAKKVLEAEAQILSYLSRFPNADCHVVPFFGLDTRTGALVLKAMDDTLESWIERELNTLDETARSQKLAAVFPTVAMSLLDSLLWMQEKGCTHADIKPSNILVSSPPSNIPTIVYSDFSSTILTIPNSDTNIVTSPVGAGTWDYLDPSLLSSRSPSSPSAATDLWSLSITLLFLVIGSSPYDAFKANKFQQREMIKSGSPLQCLQYDDQGIKNMKRLTALSKDIRFDLHKWFAKVLVKNMEKRVDIMTWKDELTHATKDMVATI